MKKSENKAGRPNSARRLDEKPDEHPNPARRLDEKPVECQNPPRRPDETLSLALSAIKRMASMVSMFNSLSLNPQARILLERAVANVAMQCGGTQSFFSSVNTLQDYSTDVELMGHPLPVVTNPNHHLNSRTEQVWPQANDTLSMPAGVITFSNDDLCCP